MLGLGNRLIGLLLVLSTTAFSQSDNPVAPISVDSVREVDTAGVYPSLGEPVVSEQPHELPISSGVLDSLLKLLDPHSVPDLGRLDLPQFSSRLDYDPFLARVAEAPWGEFESVYPLGLQPAMLSRTDDLFGDAAFANPVQVPQGEYPLRYTPSKNYYLLSPGLSQLVNPFGRLTTLHQPTPETVADTARSKVHVTRGRGGFANTYVTFANRFGSLGSVWFDGSFIKYDGLRTVIGSRDNRMRLILQPEITGPFGIRVGMFFNRLDGYEVFFPNEYRFKGLVSDNYSGMAASLQYGRPVEGLFGLDISYVNDDQSFMQTSLKHVQRFQVFETRLRHERLMGRHHLELGVQLHRVRFRAGPVDKSNIDFRLSARDMITVSDKLTLFGDASLLGGQGFSTKPTFTAVAHLQQSDVVSVSVAACHTASVPQPEMRYLPSRSASLDFAETDYHIEGEPSADIGTINSVEGLLLLDKGAIHVQGRAAYAALRDISLWQVDKSLMEYGDYWIEEEDRNLFTAGAGVAIDLPYRFYINGAYGYSEISFGNTNYSYGPQHQLSGLLGTRLFVPKLEVTLSGALGLKYRSSALRYFGGGTDEAGLITESFLSVDLKSFHFFYNFHNLLSREYYLNGLVQPGRSLWWGFTWEFLD